MCGTVPSSGVYQTFSLPAKCRVKDCMFSVVTAKEMEILVYINTAHLPQDIGHFPTYI